MADPCAGSRLGALMGSAYIGIDFGTSLIKGSVLSDTGEVLIQRAIRRQVPDPGDSTPTHHPEGVWYKELRRVTHSLVRGLQELEQSELKCIAITGMVPNVCLLDPTGQPIHEKLLFFDDRAYALELELDLELATPRWQNEVLSKLLWLRRHLPSESWGSRPLFVGTHNYLVLRLTGRYCLDSVTASECGSIFDPERGWNTDLLKRFDIHDLRMPEIVPATQIVGSLQPEAAKDLRLPQGLPVAAGTSDTISSMLGAGLRDQGDLLVYYGTYNCAANLRESMFDVLEGRHTGYPIDWIATIPRAGHQLIHMASLITGRRSPDGALRELERLARDGAPGARGLVYSQFTNFRSSTVSSDPSSAFVDFRLQHTRADMARAVLEAFGYALRFSFKESDVGLEGRRIFSAGGGARSGLWLQIVSDILGVDQYRLSTADRGLGSALLAMYASEPSLFPRRWHSVQRDAQLIRHSASPHYAETYTKYEALQNLALVQ